MRVVLALCALVLVACGEKVLNEPAPDPDAGREVEGEGGGDPLEAWPGGCTTDGACGGGKLCHLGVCVRAPSDGEAALYACDSDVVAGSTPDLGCWTQPSEPAEGPAEISARGKVVFFGDGTKTVDLTIRFYAHETFDPSPCADEGADELEIVRARAAVEACIDANTTPLATTITGNCEPDEAESGCYEVDGLPTGVPLVARITGDPNLWVATYTYGLYINPCVSPEIRKEPGTCPRGEDPAVGECDLVVDDGDTVFYKQLSVISRATWTSFPPTAGLPRPVDVGRGAVAGRLYDCRGRSMVNASFGLASEGVVTTYFNGNPDDTLPQPGLLHTNSRGTYANLDTPGGPNALVSVARQGDRVKTVAYEWFFVVPNSVTMLHPEGRRPLRVRPPYAP